MWARTTIAFQVLITVVALTGCYGGPDSADPREIVPTGATPWGTVLPKGLTLEQAGVSYVTRHSSCCTLRRNAKLDVVASYGVTKLYFDLLNLNGLTPFSVTFSDGRTVETPPLGPGESQIETNVRANEIQANGRIPIVLEPAKNLAAGPNQDPNSSPILLYAVSTDQRTAAEPNILRTSITAN
jgi:hypothetical protein